MIYYVKSIITVNDIVEYKFDGPNLIKIVIDERFLTSFTCLAAIF